MSESNLKEYNEKNNSNMIKDNNVIEKGSTEEDADKVLQNIRKIPGIDDIIDKIEENESKKFLPLSDFLDLLVASQILFSAITSGSVNSINTYLSKNKSRLPDDVANKISNDSLSLLNQYNNEINQNYKNIYKGGYDGDDFDDDDDTIIGPSLSSMAIQGTVKGITNVSKKAMKHAVNLADDFVAKVIDIASGEVLKEPWTPNVNERVIVLAEYYRQMAKDPRLLESLREFSESITDTGIELSDSILPNVKKIINKFIDAIEKIAVQGTEGAMRTFISIASSTISLIPGVGGLLSLLIAIASAFNSVMKVGLTFTQKSGEQAVMTSKTIKKGMDVVSRNKERISNSYNKITELLNSPAQPLQFGQPLSQQPLQVAQPLSQQPLQFGQPLSQQPLQFGQPLSQQPLQFGQPLSQQPLQFGQPLSQQPLQVAQPLSQQPLQVAQPLSQRYENQSENNSNLEVNEPEFAPLSTYIPQPQMQQQQNIENSSPIPIANPVEISNFKNDNKNNSLTSRLNKFTKNVSNKFTKKLSDKFTKKLSDIKSGGKNKYGTSNVRISNSLNKFYSTKKNRKTHY
jgi:hypothetical protein